VSATVVVALAAAAALFVAIMPNAKAGRALAPPRPDRPLSATAPSATASAFAFAPESVSPDAVSESAAVSTARQYAQVLPASKVIPSGVTESAYYGSYSDQNFKPRPVWLIEYTGSGVNIGGGPQADVANPPPTVYDHAESVAIDATTGQLVDEITTNPSDFPTISGNAVATTKGKAGR